MGISEMTQMGFFELFWNFSTWQLSLGVWFFAILGFVVQWLLIKKSRGRLWLALAGVLALGNLLCDIAMQAVTGLDRLIPMFFYGVILSVSVGAAMALAVYFLKPFWRRITK